MRTGIPDETVPQTDITLSMNWFEDTFGFVERNSMNNSTQNVTYTGLIKEHVDMMVYVKDIKVFTYLELPICLDAVFLRLVDVLTCSLSVS